MIEDFAEVIDFGGVAKRIVETKSDFKGRRHQQVTVHVHMHCVKCCK